MKDSKSNLKILYYTVLIFVIIQFLQLKHQFLFDTVTKIALNDNMVFVLIEILTFSSIFFLIKGLNFLFRRKIIALLIGNILFFYHIVNFFVLCFNGNNLIFTQLFYFRTAVSVLSNYKLNNYQLIIFTTAIILIIIFNASVCRLEKNEENPIKDYNKILYLIISCMLMFIPIELSGFYPSEALFTMFYTINNSAQKPKDIEKYSKKFNSLVSTKNEDLPNIIFIMNESFYEPNLKNTNLIENTRNIMKESVYSGYVYSSVYGGNTVSSEFEAITGISTAFATKGGSVYTQYLNDNIPTIVKTLKQLGYKTIAIHPYNIDGYNRKNAWTTFGFDKIISQEDFDNPDTLRGFISDKSCYDKIIDQTNDDKVFCFTTTIQNHGGYNDGPELKFTDNHQANRYLYCLRQSDLQNKEIIDYYRNSEQKTIIVFFGDHQPTFSDDTDKLTGKKTGTINNTMEYYKVPFFIWTNYDTGKQQNTNIETSINFLPSIVLNLVDVKNDWFELIYDIYKIRPVLSDNFSKTSDGTIDYNFKNDINKINVNDKNSNQYKIKTYQVMSYKYLVEK